MQLKVSTGRQHLLACIHLCWQHSRQWPMRQQSDLYKTLHLWPPPEKLQCLSVA